jgi:hypothetical protein
MRRIIQVFAALIFAVLVTRGQPIDLFNGANFSAFGAAAAGGGTFLDTTTIHNFLLTLPGGFPELNLPPATDDTITEQTGGLVPHADAGDYLFILYGTPGTPTEIPTGDVAVIFFPTAQNNFSFPPPEQGFALLYDHALNAPDAGFTLTLLAIGFTGAGLTRRALAKRR